MAGGRRQSTLGSYLSEVHRQMNNDQQTPERKLKVAVYEMKIAESRRWKENTKMIEMKQGEFLGKIMILKDLVS